MLGRLPWGDFEARDRDGRIREGRLPPADDAQPGDPDEAQCDRCRGVEPGHRVLHPDSHKFDCELRP